MRTWQWAAVGGGAVVVGGAAVLVLRKRAAATGGSPTTGSAAGPYHLGLTASAQQATINASNPAAGAVTVTVQTVQGSGSAAQPVPQQTVTLTIQRDSGTFTPTLTTDANGQAAVSLYTLHNQTMTVAATWQDPAGQTHQKTLTLTFTGGTTPAPLSTTYQLDLSVQPPTVAVGQSVTVTVTVVRIVTAAGQFSTGQTGQFAVPSAQVALTGAVQGQIVTGSSGSGQATFTPTATGTQTLTATWTDPAGVQHTASATLTVTSQAPTCGLYFDLAFWTNAGQTLPTTWGQWQSQMPSSLFQFPIRLQQDPSAIAGCPVYMAAITNNANGEINQGVVGIVGATTLAQVVQALQDAGYHLQGAPIPLAIGSVNAQGQVLLGGFTPITSASSTAS